MSYGSHSWTSQEADVKLDNHSPWYLDDDEADPYGSGAPVGWPVCCTVNAQSNRSVCRLFGYAALLAAIGCFVMMLSAHPRSDGWHGPATKVRGVTRGNRFDAAKVTALKKIAKDKEKKVYKGALNDGSTPPLTLTLT